MENIKQWLEKTEENNFKSWLVGILLFILGIVGIFLLNRFIYSGSGPKINYLLSILIIASGYKLWMASAAASVSFDFFKGIFLKHFLVSYGQERWVKRKLRNLFQKNCLRKNYLKWQLP